MASLIWKGHDDLASYIFAPNKTLKRYLLLYLWRWQSPILVYMLLTTTTLFVHKGEKKNLNRLKRKEIIIIIIKNFELNAKIAWKSCHNIFWLKKMTKKTNPTYLSISIIAEYHNLCHQGCINPNLPKGVAGKAQNKLRKGKEGREGRERGKIKEYLLFAP